MSLRAYGWNNDGTVRPDEADRIRSWAQYVADGGAVRPLVAELNDAGVPTVTNKKWAAPTITRALTHPRMIGMRDVDGELVDAPGVEPILDEGLWRQVVAVLRDPDRQRFAAGKNPQSLLSGLLRCGKCGRTLHATGPSYACSARYGGCGEISISRRLADAEVTERVLIRLTLDESLEALSDARTLSGEHYQQQIVDAEARIAHLAVTFGDGAELREAFDAGVSAARTRIDESRSRLAFLAATEALPALTEEAVIEWWADDTSVETRRSVIGVVVDHIDVRAKADAEPGAGVGDRMRMRWSCAK